MNDPATQLSSRQKNEKSEGVPKLLVMKGADTGKGVALVRSKMTVGRHPTNDLVLKDPEVSGVHLEVVREGEGGVRVRDLSSRNGTWLGANRVIEVGLVQGAEIRVGSTLVRLEFDSLANHVPISEKKSFGSFLGTSQSIREVFSTLERVAQKELPILFEGETGVGKDLLARSVFEASPRSRGRFTVIDPSLYSDEMFEKVLFGVGEDAAGAGLLEQAHGGAVYVDGVEGLSASKQSRLLQAIERKTFSRLGSSHERELDVRVFASSRKDLRGLIESSQFRDDLYYRLASVRICIPPLRERTEDITLLATAFLGELGAYHLLPDGADFIKRQSWPGNARELRSAMIWAASVSATPGIGIEQLDRHTNSIGVAELGVLPLFADAKERSVAEFERLYLSNLMRRSQGNLSKASRDSGLTRHHLRDLLKKHDLYGVSWDDRDG